jgi:hypothetical protein
MVYTCSWFRAPPAFVLVGVLALAALAIPGTSSRSAPPPRATFEPKLKGEKARNATDVNVLRQVFGNNPVTILASPGTVEGVRIVDVVDLFGKQYLRAQKKDGKPILIRTDLITSIRED